MYWMKGSETVIRCLSPCDNALEVEEYRRGGNPQGFRKLLVELSQPKAPAYRGANLRFTLDADEGKNHVIAVQLEDGGAKVDAARIDVDAGTAKLPQGDRPVTPESLSVLKSILSLKPIYKAGDIFFAFNPATLQSLRRLLRVKETQRSRETRCRAGSPISTLTVDYDPAKGVTVKPEYEDATGHPIPASAVQRGEGYLKIDEDYYLLDEASQKALSIAEKGVALGDIPEFFLRDLVLLKSSFTAVLTDKARKVTIIEEDQPPTVLISYEEPGWLDFNIVYDPKTDTPGLPQSNDGGYVTSDNYTWVRKVERRKAENDQHLKKLGARKTEKGYRLGLHAYKTLEEFIENIGGLKQASEEYQQFLDQITDFHTDENYRLPEEIEAQLEKSGRSLFPYQRTGIQWLNWLFSHNLHGLLADDMGLGKTLQSLASMRYMYDESGAGEPSLVICPVAVIRHWENEIRAVFPKATVVNIYHGQGRRITPPDGKRTIYISSYDTVVADVEELQKIGWFFVVLDEGTRIKNPGTQRAAAIKMLNAAHKLSLSGTPIENRPAELWSLFDFLMRDHLGTYSEFQHVFEKPIFEGDKEVTGELKRRVKPFILRRKKEQVAKDLPEKVEMRYWVELTGEQKLLYRRIQEAEVNPMEERLLTGQYVGYIDSILPVIMKLRQLCDHPAMANDVWDPPLGRSEKFDLVCEKIQEINEGGECCVVFTNFLGTLNLLERVLGEAGLRYIRIDGQTRDRQGLIDAFNGGGYAAALCSVLASGHGINLTAANHVIHVDNWFSPAVEDQATDRVHRIGQTRTVYVHKILVQNTLEEKIDALIKRKRGIINGVIDSELEGEKFWTRRELLEILRPL
jgi:SNF2 family DNA or RNA helicase